MTKLGNNPFNKLKINTSLMHNSKSIKISPINTLSNIDTNINNSINTTNINTINSIKNIKHINIPNNINNINKINMSPTHAHHGPIPILAKSFNEVDPIKKNKPNIFSLNEWTFMSNKKPMANTKELDKLGKQIKLKSLPEMVFINSNLKVMHHDGLIIMFNAKNALKPCVGMYSLYSIHHYSLYTVN